MPLSQTKVIRKGGIVVTVYIKNTKLPIEVSINKYNAQVGFHLRGEEIILYESIHEIPVLYQEDVLVDYIRETREILELMEIKVIELDYPEQLKAFYGRKIKKGVLGEIVNNPNNWGVFIKPSLGSKVFTGRVVKGTQDLIGIGLPFDYPIWISEVVSFVREWRCFILNGKVLDVRPYKGDYHFNYDPKVIDDAVASWTSAPSAYALDIGVTKEGRTLVVEINDGYAVGNYGLSPTLAAQFFEMRWHEVTAPYFSEHDKLEIPKI